MGPSGHFYSHMDPGVVVVNCWDRFYTLGRAPRTKETLLDFYEWYWVTRHQRVYHRLTGCQRTPGKWGVTTWYQSLGKRLPRELGFGYP